MTSPDGRDELGIVVAWMKCDSQVLEYKNIFSIHLSASSITTVSAAASLNYSSNNFLVFVQVKTGLIHRYTFNEVEGFKRLIEPIPCGTFTFCRMSVLKLNSEPQPLILLAYPSPNVENAINVLASGESNRYLMKDFSAQNSGMCLFTKLVQLKDSSVILICGFESGKLLIVNCESGKYVFDEHCFLNGESCTDADLFESTEGLLSIVAVSTAKTIKVIRDIAEPSSSTSISIPFPGCNSVSIRSDGKLFVTGGWDCKLRFYSFKSLKSLAIIDHHYDAIVDVKFGLKDGSIIAASSDGTISVWALF